jgi:hypothetical protein
MNAMVKVSFALVATFILVSPLLAQTDGDGSKPLEWRQHRVAVDKASGVSYTMTQITKLPNEGQDENLVLLIDDMTGDRLLFRYVMSFFDQEKTVEITDLDTKEFAIARNPLPFKSLTRKGAADERKANPALRELKISRMTFGINGVEFTASEDEWRSPAARDKVSAIRRAASAAFLEKLERLRVIFAGDTPIAPFCYSVLRYVFYNEACSRPGVEAKPVPPDCAFDSSFHYNCSDRQKERIAAALQTGRTLERY